MYMFHILSYQLYLPCKQKSTSKDDTGNCLLIIVMRKRVTELGCERSKCPSTILFVKSYKYKLYNDHCHPFMFCWVRKISFLMTRKDSHTILVLVPNKCVKNTFLSIIIVGNPRPVLHVLKAGIWSTRRSFDIF